MRLIGEREHGDLALPEALEELVLGLGTTGAFGLGRRRTHRLAVEQDAHAAVETGVAARHEGVERVRRPAGPRAGWACG